MNHEFQASLNDDKACIKCKRSYRDHSAIAQCEACPKVGPCELFTNFSKTVTMLLCEKCFEAEATADAHAYQAPELQEARLAEANKVRQQTIQINQLLADSNKIDQSIQLVTDIFNAQTVAIVELVKAIDADESITNKPYAKAELAVERIKHFSKVLFDAKEQVTLAENAIRASQVYLNQQASTLRDEERAKLKISDITYQPVAPKSPKPRKASGDSGTKKVASKAKVDQAEIAKWAGKIGLPANIVHMRMVKFNYTAEQAARTFAAANNITIKD